MPRRRTTWQHHFEVDSTESVWYKNFEIHCLHCLILKLTPQSQYGIPFVQHRERPLHFEVDSTESVWYMVLAGVCGKVFILKLTPQSQYGIGELGEVKGESLF